MDIYFVSDIDPTEPGYIHLLPYINNKIKVTEYIYKTIDPEDNLEWLKDLK